MVKIPYILPEKDLRFCLDYYSFEENLPPWSSPHPFFQSLSDIQDNRKSFCISQRLFNSVCGYLTFIYHLHHILLHSFLSKCFRLFWKLPSLSSVCFPGNSCMMWQYKFETLSLGTNCASNLGSELVQS